MGVRGLGEVGNGGGRKNEGMRPPGGKRGSLKSGVLTTSVGGSIRWARQDGGSAVPSPTLSPQPPPGYEHQDTTAGGGAGPVLPGAQWGPGLCRPRPP